MRKILATLAFFLSPSVMAWTLLGSDIQGWNTSELTVYVNTQDCGVDETNFLRLLDAALNAWNGVPTAQITLHRQLQTSAPDVNGFVHGTAAEVPVILCDSNFSADNNTDGDFVPAATRLGSSSDAHIRYGGILLNAEAGKEAAISGLSESELAITITHELGHVLGLGHSSSKEALMYFSIANKTLALITQDEVDALTYLYPRDELSKGPFGLSCNAVHREPERAPLGWLFGILVLALNLGVGRFFFFRRFAPRHREELR